MSDSIEDLKSVTTARVDISRCGVRPKTATWLHFRQDHALAKDAVVSELSESVLSYARELNLPVVQTTAVDKEDFIAFPPKGKVLPSDTLKFLTQPDEAGKDVQIVVSDGLSAYAVEHNIAVLLPSLIEALTSEGLTHATPVLVRYGRVAVADQIAHARGARLAINLIGERPGLSAPGSMSAYLTYDPGLHTISSDRTVLSNIHSHGTVAESAGPFLAKLSARILSVGLSGVKLQNYSETDSAWQAHLGSSALSLKCNA